METEDSPIHAPYEQNATRSFARIIAVHGVRTRKVVAREEHFKDESLSVPMRKKG